MTPAQWLALDTIATDYANGTLVEESRGVREQELRKNAQAALEAAFGDDPTDADVLASYAVDESEVPPHPPEAVVRVREAREVADVMRICAEHSVPVTPRPGRQWHDRRPAGGTPRRRRPDRDGPPRHG